MAQNVRLNGYAAYVFDDAVDSYYSETDYFSGTIKGGFQWGAGIEYLLPSQFGIELTYLRQDTNAPTDYISNPVQGLQFANFDLGINYIMLGGNKYVKVKPQIEPYGGLQAGVAIFDLSNPVNNNKSNSTKFAWGLKGGVNFYASPKVAIKIQASLLSSVQAVGGTFYFGTGGTGAGVGSYSSMLQFVIGGGLTVNLN
ncbi:hypothetical protein D3C80_712910 [compost metagenome]